MITNLDVAGGRMSWIGCPQQSVHGTSSHKAFSTPVTRTRLADALLAPASPTVSMQASEQSIPGRVVRTTTATPSPCASLRATPAATSRPLSPPSKSKPGSGARARSRVGEFEPPEPEASSASTKQHVISWLHFDTRAGCRSYRRLRRRPPCQALPAAAPGTADAHADGHKQQSKAKQ